MSLSLGVKLFPLCLVLILLPLLLRHRHFGPRRAACYPTPAHDPAAAVGATSRIEANSALATSVGLSSLCLFTRCCFRSFFSRFTCPVSYSPSHPPFYLLHLASSGQLNSDTRSRFILIRAAREEVLPRLGPAFSCEHSRFNARLLAAQPASSKQTNKQTNE